MGTSLYVPVPVSGFGDESQLRSCINPIPDLWGGMETHLSLDDVMYVFSSVECFD